MKRLCIHGVTGSIGRQTLAVIDLHPERFRVDAISAGRDLRGLAEICARYQPRWAVIADPALYQEAVREIAVGAPNTQLLAGPQSL